MPPAKFGCVSLKVLHVYRTYFPDSQGGLEEVIRQICVNTRAEGVESRVFSLSENPVPPVIDSAEARIVRVKRSFEIASCGFCFRGLKEFSRQVAWADLVHYHFPWPFADLMYSLYGKSRPSLITYHSDIVRQKFLSWLYGPLMRHFLGSVQRIVATSPNYLATSDVLSGIHRDIDIVPIGLQRESYPPVEELDEEIETARARYGEGFFLFVGVLRYYKGLHILLDAARDAAFKVVIVGIGPQDLALRRQAEKLGLENVVFTGYLPDREKMALFHLCRAVVFPSYLRSEAFGVTLLEGAMSGRPLISAEVGSGSSHINLHEQTGLVVTPGCPRSLRNAMDALYRDPAQAERMGGAARQRFEAHFTGSEMGRRYASIYRQILRGEPAAGSAAVGGVA